MSSNNDGKEVKKVLFSMDMADSVFELSLITYDDIETHAYLTERLTDDSNIEIFAEGISLQSALRLKNILGRIRQ